MKHLLLTLLICTAAPAGAEPLAGRIWDTRAGEFVSFQTMLTAVLDKRYILVGERHGREAHQNREAFLIGALVEAGREPAIVLEMLSRDQSPVVEAYRQEQPEYAMGLAVALDWPNSNWPSWSYYYPVFNMAFAAKLPVTGGDLPDGVEGTITYEQELASLEYYKRSMETAHCGLIDEARALELARTQMARDQSMALSLQRAEKAEGGALLIAGSSHVGRETGVPTLLEPDEVSAIALRETESEVEAFREGSADVTQDDISQFDFVWFTPKTEDNSFCERIGD